MRRTHPTLRIRHLVPVLLLLILVPGMGAWAEDTPPGRLVSPVSVGRGMLLSYNPSSDTIYLTSAPALSNLPNALSFTYSIPDQRLLPADHRMTPLNVGDSSPLTWTVATEGAWFTTAPTGGTTPASFWITPTAFSTGTVATYTGAVTVTVVDPAGVEGSPHRVDLTLRVVDTSLSHIHLPLILRNYTPSPPPPLYPNDPYYTSQWALEKVDAPEAWGISTGQEVLIAILDSGTDLDHPDLADEVRTDIDRDFVNDDGEADDDHGHGTHVSGIAAAATNNAQGVAGLGWEATLLPLKVLDADGNGYADDLADAIRYAADQGAEVINMSLGGAVPCPWYVQDAVDYAYAGRVILVAAAGNNQGNTENFPANCTHVLGVAATDPDDTRASYSNYGNHVSVAAPGSGIYSTLMGGWYGYMSGTSMATPYVAGLAALVYSRYPTYTPDQVASAILDNALDIGTPGWDMYTGCGRIEAFSALWVGAHGSSPVCLEGVGPYLKSQTPNPNPQIVPGEIIVALRPGVSVEAVSLQYKTSAEFLPTLDAWLFHVPPGQERAILAWLRADPAVAHADLNYVVTAAP